MIFTGATEEQKVEFLKQNDFYCLTLRAWLSPTACVANQRKAVRGGKDQRGARPFYDTTTYHCCDCENGKKYWTDAERKVEIEQRVCEMYQANPNLCKNQDNNGVFIREGRHTDAAWRIKKTCCPGCSVNINTLRTGMSLPGNDGHRYRLEKGEIIKSKGRKRRN